METNTELWIVTYLHDWDDDGKVYPQVHSIHERWHDAEAERKGMINPEKYWVVRGRIKAPSVPK